MVHLPGALPETDGRAFMALLDMCHFLVDQITGDFDFEDLGAASRLRAEREDQAMMLTAKMYSYWDSAPAGPGVYERLLQWTAEERSASFATREARTLGKAAASGSSLTAGLYAIAKVECVHWSKHRVTGTFYLGKEAEGGAALMADAELKCVYAVTGLSASLCDLIRSSGRYDIIGAPIRLTLLPFMGVVVYDGTMLGGMPSRDPNFISRLKAVVNAAEAEGKVITRLPAKRAAEPPLLGKRVLISGLKGRPELNGTHGVAVEYFEERGRYGVHLDFNGESVAMKPENLTECAEEAAPAAVEANAPLTAYERDLAARLRKIASGGSMETGDMWVFRRMGYTEAENPTHEAVIISSRTSAIVPASKSYPMVKYKRLAPTSDEVLRGLEGAIFECSYGKVKPASVAVDEKSVIDRLKVVLEPAGIHVGYYPPPSEEELTSMSIMGR